MREFVDDVGYAFEQAFGLGRRRGIAPPEFERRRDDRRSGPLAPRRYGLRNRDRCAGRATRRCQRLAVLPWEVVSAADRWLAAE